MKNFIDLLRVLARPGFFSNLWPCKAHRALLIALGLVLCGLPAVSTAQASAINRNAAATEESIKAAYLFKFLNYVDWPPAAFPRADSPYVIGVVNADAIADALSKQAAGRTVNNRPVIVRKFTAGDKIAGIHVLFIGKNEHARQLQLQKQLQSQPVLLVTESDGALAQGSMINFKLVDDRVRFEISLGPVEKSGLRINARMLEVAVSVTKGEQQ